MGSKKARRKPPFFQRIEVAEAFAALPPAPRDKLLQLRTLIFETAAATPGVGPIEEALRWGEPSYLTSESKSGTTLRIHWKARRPDRCALYVHCQTNLLEQYRRFTRMLSSSKETVQYCSTSSSRYLKPPCVTASHWP